jgi:DNA-binding MarR family transcriptional regulator
MEQLSPLSLSKKLASVMPRVLREFLRRQADVLAQGKITAPQYCVLDLLFTGGAQKMGSLAAEIGVSLPAMTGVVERLYRIKLLERIHDTNDRRVVNIELTSQGRQTISALREKREKTLAEIFAKLSENDRRHYLRIILKIKDILYTQGVVIMCGALLLADTLAFGAVGPGAPALERSGVVLNVDDVGRICFDNNLNEWMEKHNAYARRTRLNDARPMFDTMRSACFFSERPE